MSRNLAFILIKAGAIDSDKGKKKKPVSRGKNLSVVGTPIIVIICISLLVHYIPSWRRRCGLWWRVLFPHFDHIPAKWQDFPTLPCLFISCSLKTLLFLITEPKRIYPELYLTKYTTKRRLWKDFNVGSTSEQETIKLLSQEWQLGSSFFLNFCHIHLMKRVSLNPKDQNNNYALNSTSLGLRHTVGFSNQRH